MQRRLATLVIALCATAMVSGCGFHLRGSGGASVPEEWRSLFLVTSNPNSEFSREVKLRFANAGIEWADDRADANYLLVLGPERFIQRNLSLDADTRAAEFELTMRSTFSINNARGKGVMPDTTGTVIKQMENDPQNVVGKAEEIRILKAEMRSELSQQILRRIAFFAASQTPEA